VLQGSLSYLCNFDFGNYKEVLQNILFNDYGADQTKDPALDLRIRLKIDVEGSPLRKVYKGG
jgi:hypothetical protein